MKIYAAIVVGFRTVMTVILSLRLKKNSFASKGHLHKDREEMTVEIVVRSAQWYAGWFDALNLFEAFNSATKTEPAMNV